MKRPESITPRNAFEIQLCPCCTLKMTIHPSLSAARFQKRVILLYEIQLLNWMDIQ
jgi:hypothetical protein